MMGDKELKQDITTIQEYLEKISCLSTAKSKRFILHHVRKSLQADLEHTCQNKRKVLKLISKNLPQKVFQNIFLNLDHPAISLVLCVYNMEQYLRKSLDSLVQQTLKNIEIICVDDGSTDTSLKILREYAKHDKRIKILTQKNLGLSIARYNAMKKATGEYISYVDADDYLELDACECLYLYSKIYALDMCSFMAVEFDDKTQKSFKNSYHCLEWVGKHFPPVLSIKKIYNIVHKIAVSSCLTLYKNQFLKENNIKWLKKRIAFEDTLFFTESLFKAKKFGVLKETFYHRRIHKAAITQNLNKFFSDWIQIIIKLWEIVERYGNQKILRNYLSMYTPIGWKIYKGLSRQSQYKYTEDMMMFCKKLLQKYHYPLSNEMLSWYTDRMFFKKVLQGYYKGISDEQMLNMKQIFNKSCVCAQKVQVLQILFNKLADHKNSIKSDDYAMIWGSGNWDPQPKIVAAAIQNGIPLIRAEDGFLRSVDTWVNQNVEKKYTAGISATFSNDVHYFDATKSSFLERLINNHNLTFSSQQLTRARKCINFIIRHSLTKYNHQPIYTPNIGRKDVKKVLVVDQSYGDFSVSKGLSNVNTFQTMLETAINENPHADIIIKGHPDTLTQGINHPVGYFSGYNPHNNIYLLKKPINPLSLIKYCDKVYVVTSQFGFEALMCGKEVHVFGMPFYAGWGLTHDALICPRRTNRRSLEELFYIAYILYSYYVNPDTGKICEIEEAMNYLLSLRKEYFAKFHLRKS